MKLRKILTPVLATIGSVAAATPLICLTSCGQEAEEKEMFNVAGEHTKQVTKPTTGTWTIDATCDETIPSNVKVTAVVKSLDSNVDIVQCTSTIEGIILHINVGYVTQEVTVKETTEFTAKFKLHFEWSEKIDSTDKNFQQTLSEEFHLIYKVEKA